MRFTIYFERDPFEDHITRDQWYAAVGAVDGVRLVAANSAGPDTWLGYFVNPRGRPGQQFHDRPDRAHDAEVYFHNTQDWRRAFYWYEAMGDFAGGVITFDSRVSEDDSWRTDPVHLASLALAEVLNAKLVGEDDTNYEV